MLGTSIARNQKVEGSGFKQKGEVNSPKAEPHMERIMSSMKKIENEKKKGITKPRMVSIDGSEPVEFRF